MNRRGSVITFHYKLFADDCVSVLRNSGFHVHMLEPRGMNVALFQSACEQVQPNFVFTINFSPEIAFLSTLFQIPYISWTLDPLPLDRFRVIQGTRTELGHHFAHDRVTVNKLLALGLTQVDYLPAAAPLHKRAPILDETQLDSYRTNISFVGSSIVSEQHQLWNLLRAHNVDNETIFRIEQWLWDLCQHEADETTFRKITHFPDWFPKVEDERFQELNDAILGCLSSILRIWRIQQCASLGITVYGDDAWQTVTSAYRGTADHGEQLTQIYNASKLNLDIPRVYQRDIVTMRVFDALLCGSVVLTEPSADLCDMFVDGKHVLIYRNMDELKRVYQATVHDDALLQSIGENGRSAVLAQHLIEHRVDRIVACATAHGWV